MQQRGPHREPDLFAEPFLPPDGAGLGGGEPDAAADVADPRPGRHQAYVSWSELDSRIAAIYRAYDERKQITGCGRMK